MEENDFYRLLVQRYIENKATEEELKAFFQLLKEGKLDVYLTDAMNAASFSNDAVEDVATAGKRKIFTLRRIAVAAVVLLFFSAGTYIAFKKDKKQSATAHIQKQPATGNDIVPGSDKAVLILADGSKIKLDNEHNGLLAQQGKTKVVKLNRQLVYNANNIKPNEISYNTIITPPGGQYQITLSDGTTVWLNAASSLRFPTAFAGKERRVELTGEGYFEVAHNEQIPFIVKKGDAEVKVLGTHFNVNAYDDEQEIKITLLQGSVKVSQLAANHTQLLTPGQQAQINKSGAIKLNKSADVDEAVAWKNGVFQFEGADIQEVMRQIARWYDVEVVYQGQIDQHFRGTISKNVEASKVLQMLELTGTVHFKIENKKIIVTP